MKIVTTTGFYGTGSSAITDLLSEYENVMCKGDLEIRLAHDPYGISDLEYNLIENPNRHNSSHALKKFMKVVKRLHGYAFSHVYESYFNGKFNIYSQEYIKKLVQFEYFGKWHYDLIERGDTIYFISRSYNKVISILKKICRIRNDVTHSLVPENEKAYATISDEQEFLNVTREYFDKLFLEINPENREFIMLDQLVPPSNIERYERYFSNLSAIIVDRDPRDLFLLEKCCWKGHTVPHYNVDKFCQWYVWTREQYERMPKGNSCKIQFEDLIYRYEKTVKVIEEFLGLDAGAHTMKRKKLIPEVSRKNTRLWEQYRGYEKEIQIIEERLAKYCYDYSQISG